MEMEDLKDLLDFSNASPEQFREVVEAFAKYRNGRAALATVLLKATGLINIMPTDLLDQMILDIEAEDLSGVEEESRDGVVQILEAIRKIKPIIDPVVNKIREQVALRHEEAEAYGNLPKRR